MICFALAIITSLAGVDSNKETIQKEQTALQGKWISIAIEIDGKAINPEFVKSFPVTLAIMDDKFTLTNSPATVKGSFKIDPAARPNKLDLNSVSEDGKITKIMGIYELNEGSFKCCIGKDIRPSEFKSSPNRAIMITFERTRN